MTLVEVFSKDECHLCDVALENIRNVQRAVPFELRVTKILEGEGRYEEFKERVPVIFVNGKFAFQYRVTERALVAVLKEAEVAA